MHLFIKFAEDVTMQNMGIQIRKIDADKKQFLELLLLADEQEDMIDRYLDRGEMFALYNDEQSVVAVAVVTQESEAVVELKNLAVAPKFQRKGYGRQMVEFIIHHYSDRYHTLLVGTGDSIQTTSFYKSCGFHYSHTVEEFFTKNYDHPIYEEGKQLRDMLYFSRQIGQ